MKLYKKITKWVSLYYFSMERLMISLCIQSRGSSQGSIWFCWTLIWKLSIEYGLYVLGEKSLIRLMPIVISLASLITFYCPRWANYIYYIFKVSSLIEKHANLEKSAISIIYRLFSIKRVNILLLSMQIASSIIFSQ